MLRTLLAVSLLATAFLAAPAVAAGNGPPPFVFPDVCCYLDGEVVRTVTPPATTPHQGRDAIYAIQEGAEGQLGVVAVGPGSPDYHGGHWAVYVVTWNTEPYLLTSDEAVLAAAEAGDVTVTRHAEADFRCPIQR